MEYPPGLLQGVLENLPHLAELLCEGVDFENKESKFLVFFSKDFFLLFAQFFLSHTCQTNTGIFGYSPVDM